MSINLITDVSLIYFNQEKNENFNFCKMAAIFEFLNSANKKRTIGLI